MPVLATLSGVLSIAFAILAVTFRVTRRWRSPSGAFSQRVESSSKTWTWRGIFGAGSIASLYVCGYLFGWWA